MTDKRVRSIVKAISWRVIAVLVTFIISFIITGRVLIAISIGLLDSFVKIFAYYIHERTWNMTDYGRKPLKNKKGKTK